jgi:hypothetical protein
MGEWSSVEGDPIFPIYFGERISLYSPQTSSSGPYAGGNLTGDSSRLAVGLYEPNTGRFSVLLDSSTSFYKFYIFTMNTFNRVEGQEWTYNKNSSPTGSGTYYVAHRTKSWARVRTGFGPGVGKVAVDSPYRNTIDQLRAANESIGEPTSGVREMAKRLEGLLQELRLQMN